MTRTGVYSYTVNVVPTNVECRATPGVLLNLSKSMNEILSDRVCIAVIRDCIVVGI